MEGLIELREQVFERNLTGWAIAEGERLSGCPGIEELEPRLWCELPDSRGLFHPNANRLLDFSYPHVSGVLKLDEIHSTVECRLLTVL